MVNASGTDQCPYSGLPKGSFSDAPLRPGDFCLSRFLPGGITRINLVLQTVYRLTGSDHINPARIGLALLGVNPNAASARKAIFYD